jgi:hypothetical protein
MFTFPPYNTSLHFFGISFFISREGLYLLHFVEFHFLISFQRTLVPEDAVPERDAKVIWTWEILQFCMLLYIQDMHNNILKTWAVLQERNLLCSLFPKCLFLSRERFYVFLSHYLFNGTSLVNYHWVFWMKHERMYVKDIMMANNDLQALRPFIRLWSVGLIQYRSIDCSVLLSPRNIQNLMLSCYLLIYFWH